MENSNDSSAMKIVKAFTTLFLGWLLCSMIFLTPAVQPPVPQFDLGIYIFCIFILTVCSFSAGNILKSSSVLFLYYGSIPFIAYFTSLASDKLYWNNFAFERIDKHQILILFVTTILTLLPAYICKIYAKLGAQHDDSHIDLDGNKVPPDT